MQVVTPNNPEIHQRIVEFSDGQQILIRDAPELKITIDIDDAEVVKEVRVDDMPHQEFRNLSRKAMTHRIKTDTIGKNISIIPKETPMQKTQESPADKKGAKKA